MKRVWVRKPPSEHREVRVGERGGVRFPVQSQCDSLALSWHTFFSCVQAIGQNLVFHSDQDMGARHERQEFIFLVLAIIELGRFRFIAALCTRAF